MVSVSGGSTPQLSVEIVISRIVCKACLRHNQPRPTNHSRLFHFRYQLTKPNQTMTMEKHDLIKIEQNFNAFIRDSVIL